MQVVSTVYVLTWQRRVELGGEQTKTSHLALCGVPDRFYQPQHYVLGPSKWNKSHLSFR